MILRTALAISSWLLTWVAVAQTPKQTLTPLPAEAWGQQSLVFAAQGTAYLVNSDLGLMGVPFLADVSKAFGFSGDGSEFLYLKSNGTLPGFSLHAWSAGSQSERLVTRGTVLSAAWRPHSRDVALLRFESFDRMEVVLHDGLTGEDRTLLEGVFAGSSLAWSEDGARLRIAESKPLSKNYFEERRVEWMTRELEVGTAPRPGGARSRLGRQARLAERPPAELEREVTPQGVTWKLRQAGAETVLRAVNVSYRLPYDGQASLAQGGTGFSGGACDGTVCNITSHVQELQFALDFQIHSPEPPFIREHVLAIADGTVVEARDGVLCNGNPACVDYKPDCVSNGVAGNFVVIAHADGTYSLYAHLKPGSIRVLKGQTVCQGFHIGDQGHSGSTSGAFRTCGDHLHFQRQLGPGLMDDPFVSSVPTDFAELPCTPSCWNPAYTSQNIEVLACTAGPPTTIQTSPAGLQIIVDGPTLVAPQTFYWLPGTTRSLDAPSPQTVGGTRYRFQSWSQGGAQQQLFTAPSVATTITAMFSVEPPLNRNQRFVNLLYRNFLGRSPDPGGYSFWLGLLDSGSMSHAQMASAFFNAPEFNVIERFVAGLYVVILGRDAEFGGWHFHRTALRAGLTSQSQLVAAFLTSEEHSLRYGSLSTADFVVTMYRNALGRDPAPGELSAWVAQLAGGGSRAALVQVLLNSPEFQTARLARLNAFLLYAAILSRDPDPGGMAAWVAFLQGGAPLDAAIAGFIGSPEFQAILGP